jgi:hypothetical protein
VTSNEQGGGARPAGGNRCGRAQPGFGTGPATTRRGWRVSWATKGLGRVAWLLVTAAAGHAMAQTHEPGEANIARFGALSLINDNNPGQPIDVSLLASGKGTVTLAAGTRLVCEWRQPRDVRAVRLWFKGQPPEPGIVTLEWWHDVWPDNGTGGWMRLDDPFNGDWVPMRCAVTTDQAELRFQCRPLNTNEVPNLPQTGQDFRHTYKLRISSSQPLTLQRLGVYTGATEKRARLRFEWNLKTTVPGAWSPRFTARNGQILRVHPAGRDAAVVEVRYVDATNRLSADRGSVVFRSGPTRSFSVFVDDVMRAGGLFVRDVGVFVGDADRRLTFSNWRGPSGPTWLGTVEELVAGLPEQTLDQARRAFPSKPPVDCFLGVPNLRQEIAVSPKGDIVLYADSLRSPGVDAEMRPWHWKELRLQFGSGEHPVMGGGANRRVKRSLEDGWLPVVRHEWRSGDLDYTETCVVGPLEEDIGALQTPIGTEPIVLAARFAITNTSAAPRTAYLWMATDHPLPLHVAVDGTLVLNAPSDGVQRADLVPIRGRFNTLGKGDLDMAVLVPGGSGGSEAGLKHPAEARPAIRYQVRLAAHQGHAVELAVPYIELLDTHDLAALKAVSFARLHDSVVRFWRARVARGMTYEVPDTVLNAFFKANLWHVLISVDIDPINALYELGAATHGYGNYLNETAMAITTLEMRGEHNEAGRLLLPFLLCQGVKGLPGNFKTKDGVFYAAYPTTPDPYTAQGYNMDHGWGLWAAADHFFWTRDQAYLRDNADRLIKGCDWVTRERQATMVMSPDGARPLEYGLAPAGDLEDVSEFLYYYATDGYFYRGMRRAAEALAAAGHPEAGRIAQEADAFLQDLRASVAEAVATSPVVRLRDGTCIPYVPPRPYALTHLSEGWIREGLYPALHLLDCGVFPARHPFADWMIDDLEDNIFMSRECGYGLAHPGRDFFNRGGFTLQPDLLDLALDYLKRDEIPNFLRAFYNTFAVSFYPDIACFAEWVPKFGEGAGPVYKVSDESKFIQWMRDMLILERGDTLDLGLGVPRRWMADGDRIKVQRAATYFGPLDLEIDSHARFHEVSAQVRLTARVAPAAIRLRLRSPDGAPIRSATVNGQPARIDAKRQLIDLPLNATAWTVHAQF